MSPQIKVRVWKTFKLEETKEALEALFAKGKGSENSFKRKLDS